MDLVLRIQAQTSINNDGDMKNNLKKTQISNNLAW